MNNTLISDKYYAVLIDADNVSTKYAHGILEEISKYGTPSIKRIYGDWSAIRLKKWKDLLPELAITPIQQFGHTVAKNASDIALIIDAIDLLYTQQITGFCIVSSDSDFTKLVTRLKESTKHIIGMGEKKTPQPFIASCSKFIYLENLIEEDEDIESKISPHKSKKTKPKQLDKDIKRFIKNVILEFSDDNGWTYLSRIGMLLNESRPDFDPRNYNCRNLNEIIKHHSNDFEIKLDTNKKSYLVKVID